MTTITTGEAIHRITHDLADLLTPRARRWIVGWLVGASMRGMPMPHLYGLTTCADSYGPTAFDDSAVRAEWDFNDSARDIAMSLDLGLGPGRCWWFCGDLHFEESHEVSVTLDGETSARVVELIRAVMP